MGEGERESKYNAAFPELEQEGEEVGQKVVGVLAEGLKAYSTEVKDQPERKCELHEKKKG